MIKPIMCNTLQESGHLSYKCPKNALGEREPPPKKKKKTKARDNDSDSDFGEDIVIVKKPAAAGNI